MLQSAYAQTLHPRLLEAGVESGLPLVMPNDNRNAAGKWNDGVLELDLEVLWADWRVETPDRPGLRVAAAAESGGNPQIPSPLIRVETGTTIRATVRNTLTDSSITVFGFQPRPAEEPDSLVVEPSSTGSVNFEVGAPGTYFYWIQIGAGTGSRMEEREQLAGAFIIDPEGGSAPDRVFVINVFGTPIDPELHEWGGIEALTINGLSWPYTERIRPSVGDTLRWRVINASKRPHPMHLHGFFYDITSIGRFLADNIYEVRDRRSVVTQSMRRRSTMTMEWVPTRPGNWLFHCHLSFHVSPEIRLPSVSESHDEEHQHMAGLVIGIEVADGPTDLIEHGEPRYITLYAKEFADFDSSSTYGFTLDPDFEPMTREEAVPGPALVLRQYQPTFVTVENRMSFPTGVHWHGLELDSWSDGVPGWSKSDGRVSPVIPPGGSFTYKLSLMRPGTFIYHSHLDDVKQLTGGLYGPLLVLAKEEVLETERDHIYVHGWGRPDPREFADMDLNGRTQQPDQYATVGETHRIRLINIAPAGRISLRMEKDSLAVPLKLLAKDGSNLPKHQQVEVDTCPKIDVGETADYAFTPTAPGTYDLVFDFWEGWRQRWIVGPAGGR